MLVLPVETHVAGLVLHAISLDERGQCCRDAREYGLVAVFFLQLNLFPAFQYGFGILGHRFSIDVWMTEYQLVAQLVADICYIKLLLLLAYSAIENDV